MSSLVVVVVESQPALSSQSLIRVLGVVRVVFFRVLRFNQKWFLTVVVVVVVVRPLFLMVAWQMTILLLGDDFRQIRACTAFS